MFQVNQLVLQQLFLKLAEISNIKVIQGYNNESLETEAGLILQIKLVNNVDDTWPSLCIQSNLMFSDIQV